MTNKELINKLSEFPEDAKVNFCLFSNLTPRRCDVRDYHVMILRSPHNGEVNIMLDLEEYWERDILESARLHQKPDVV
jgi:hypothetical protein